MPGGFAGVVLPVVLATVAACGGATPTSSPATPTAATPRTAATQSPPASSPAATASPPTSPESPTQARIAFLVQRVQADPEDGDAQLELGLALLQRIRETADPSLYGPAEKALTVARRLLPNDANPLVGLGGLQLGRHQFAAALRTGRAALKLDPASVGAGSIEVDALIELGRYEEAFPAAERLAARAPNLTTLSRLSYTRELQGDLAGALEAMRTAAASPSGAAENTAFALSIVGHLERLGGDATAGRAAYEQALGLVPDHAPSLAGLGRLAVGDGDLDGAASIFERAAAILPLPEYVIALGEVHDAADDLPAARRQYDLAAAEIGLYQANGVAVDLDLALFETDHGDPARALDLARAAYRAAPTVRAADALAWCLHHTGGDAAAKVSSDEALRLGSRDPLFLYHAGVIAMALNDPATARDRLDAALAGDPGFSATGVRAARSLLGVLGAGS
jgi:tetratricopeptide (TPR) repeat protein